MQKDKTLEDFAKYVCMWEAIRLLPQTVYQDKSGKQTRNSGSKKKTEKKREATKKKKVY